VPSQRCPDCGRILPRGIVASLIDGTAPCPRCGTDLDASALARDTPAAADQTVATSVRPPDLIPDLVRDDVLAGWDVGVGPAEMARWGDDRRPFPTDTVVVAGAAMAGCVLGVVLDDRHGRGAALGTVVGGVAGAAARRVWRLEP
jgi:hypothetical protein